MVVFIWYLSKGVQRACLRVDCDVILDSVKMAFRDEDSILDHIHVKKICSDMNVL